MIQKICDPVQRNGGLAASGASLDHQYLILCIADDRILLFLYRPYDIFQLYIAVISQFLFQYLIIDLRIALKGIDHFTAADLILPFGTDLTCNDPRRSFIGRRSFIIIIKKTAHRRSPVVDQRRHACLFGKIPDTDIERFRIIFSFKYKIHSSEKGRIFHLLKAVFHFQLFRICICLLEQSLTVIVFLITVLVHLCIVLPVVFMHIFDLFFSFTQVMIDLIKPVLYFNGHVF